MFLATGSVNLQFEHLKKQLWCSGSDLVSLIAKNCERDT